MCYAASWSGLGPSSPRCPEGYTAYWFLVGSRVKSYIGGLGIIFPYPLLRTSEALTDELQRESGHVNVLVPRNPAALTYARVLKKALQGNGPAAFWIILLFCFSKGVSEAVDLGEGCVCERLVSPAQNTSP